MKRFIVFGYAAHDDRPKTRRAMSELAAALGDETGLDVATTPVPTSARLAVLLERGDVDVAWVNPITLVSLARNRIVRPVVSVVRSDRGHYRCAIVVRAGAQLRSLRDLRDKRAAWVDRHSASGFVLPRIELARHRVFAGSLKSECVVGSHMAVVRAVASGGADFGATYLHISTDGAERGPWSDTNLERSIVVLARFGEIPPDAIVVRYDLGRDAALTLRAALRALGATSVASEALGASAFAMPSRTAYEALRANVFHAYQRGLLDIDVDQVTLTDGGATEERRAPLNEATRQRVVSSTRVRPNNTTEIDAADVLHVIDA